MPFHDIFDQIELDDVKLLNCINDEDLYGENSKN